jgi:hypothetical protein
MADDVIGKTPIVEYALVLSLFVNNGKHPQGLLKEISTPASKNCTRLELSESYSRGTGCRVPAVRKLGTSGSAGAPGRQLPGSTRPFNTGLKLVIRLFFGYCL